MEDNITTITQSDLQEVAGECLCLQMRQTARRLSQRYDEYLQPSGLRLTQVSLLVAIALAHAIPLTRLADILALDRTTLARNLKPLERDGLVEVSPGVDKRVHLIRLTEQGQQHLLQALPYWRQAQEEVRASLGSSQWEALRADLRRLDTQLSS